MNSPQSDVVHTSYTTHKKFDSLSIPVSSSLDHYTTDEVHGLSSWFIISRATTENVWGIVGGYGGVCGIVHPCQTLSMPHTTLRKEWDIISIYASSSLDHYTTDNSLSILLFGKPMGEGRTGGLAYNSLISQSTKSDGADFSPSSTISKNSLDTPEIQHPTSADCSPQIWY